MLTACRRIVYLGLCFAAIGSVTRAADGYRVILRDGSYIQALEKPVVEGGIAKVRLGGGLFAAVPEGRIDWRRSDAASAEDRMGGASATASPAPHRAARPVASGVFTLIGGPQAAPAAGGTASPEGAPAAAAPDPGADTRARISALNDELDELQRAKLDLEDRIRKTIKLEEIPDLRHQADQIDADIKSKRGEISALILQETGAQHP
jgi:hypothetical protein